MVRREDGHTDYFTEAVSDGDARALALCSPHAVWKLGCLLQLFPFDPCGCLMTNDLERGISGLFSSGTFSVSSFSHCIECWSLQTRKRSVPV